MAEKKIAFADIRVKDVVKRVKETRTDNSYTRSETWGEVLNKNSVIVEIEFGDGETLYWDVLSLKTDSITYYLLDRPKKSFKVDEIISPEDLVDLPVGSWVISTSSITTFVKKSDVRSGKEYWYQASFGPISTDSLSRYQRFSVLYIPTKITFQAGKVEW